MRRAARDRRGAVIPRRSLPLVVAVAWLLVTGTVVVAATSSSGGAASAGKYVGAVPQGFPKPRVPATNPMTRAKIKVGRRLFYDKRLSGNGTQSCASCHQQQLAFTDGRAVAVGSTGELHPRNAQSLVNVVYNQTLTWANPALVTLERQIEVPLFSQHPVEMGVTNANKNRILARLRRDRWYRRHFPRAFPKASKPLSWQSIVQSITTFQRTIVSADSRYDRYLRGRAKLTAAQRRGMNLFTGERAECHHCHGSFIFNDQATYAGALDCGPCSTTPACSTSAVPARSPSPTEACSS